MGSRKVGARKLLGYFIFEEEVHNLGMIWLIRVQRVTGWMGVFRIFSSVGSDTVCRI